MRDGSSPFAITSNQTSPVNRSAGPLAVGCFGCISTSAPFVRMASAVPPAVFYDATGLFHGERPPPAADPGARPSVPEDLVDDQGYTDGCDETEGDKGRHKRRDRNQPKQEDRRDRTAPS